DWYASRDLLELEGVNYTLDVSFPDLYDALTTWGQQDRLPIEPELYEHEVEKHTYTFDIEFVSDIREVPYIPAPLYSKVKLEEGGTIDTEYSDYYPVPWNVTVNELGDVTVEAVKCSQQAEEFAAKAGGSFEQFIGVMRSAMKSLERITENDETYENEDGTPKNGYELEAFMAQYYENYYAYAQQNYCYDPEYIREAGLKDYKKIKALADEICKDCKSDYEKAKAIEQYFTDEGFEYDLEYIPEEETVSYFLFESKKGICIDFATAMGVMMIMERIPVRYVEGFVAFERDPEDSSRLIVRDSHAHAFIEAFIPYVGWMTFDPTVAGYMDIAIGEDKDDTGTLGLILSYMGRILLVLGVLFVLVFIILFDRIWELCFRGTLRFYSPDKKLTRLYRHISGLLEYEDKTDLKPYTAKLLNDYLRDKTGESLTAVTDLFEQHRFGNRPVSEAQFEAAFEAYKALYPKIRKKK
ncbi:MAG: transglutaminase domain-containing protein, partial [Ruminococcus sp.]|nr:transglutaminase domain-containing protein [Ruminococcus sp.]